MADRLTRQQIEGMFEAYQEKPNYNYVAKKCKINWKTAQKYCKSEKWDERLAKLRQMTIEKADVAIVTETTKHRKIAEGVISIFAQSLIGHAVQACPGCGAEVRMAIPRPNISPTDFDRMVRLINEQLGGIDIKPRKHIIELVEPSGQIIKENENG